MTITNRWEAPLEQRRPEHRLGFVSALLRHLDVTTAPAADQKAAVTAWLVDHEPDPLLEAGLRHQGYLPAI